MCMGHVLSRGFWEHLMFSSEASRNWSVMSLGLIAARSNQTWTDGIGRTSGTTQTRLAFSFSCKTTSAFVSAYPAKLTFCGFSAVINRRRTSFHCLHTNDRPRPEKYLSLLISVRFAGGSEGLDPLASFLDPPASSFWLTPGGSA